MQGGAGRLSHRRQHALNGNRCGAEYAPFDLAMRHRGSQLDQAAAVASFEWKRRCMRATSGLTSKNSLNAIAP
jgi:hypothetical protein